MMPLKVARDYVLGFLAAVLFFSVLSVAVVLGRIAYPDLFP